MSVEVDIPQEFQGAIIGGINRRKGAILSTNSDDRGFVTVDAEVPLASMFGYSTELRSNTQGPGRVHDGVQDIDASAKEYCRRHG